MPDVLDGLAQKKSVIQELDSEGGVDRGLSRGCILGSLSFARGFLEDSCRPCEGLRLSLSDVKGPFAHVIESV